MSYLSIEKASETLLIVEQQKEKEKCIKLCLATLRIAFPTQARNYSEDEYNLLFNLWSHIFADIDPQILQKAVISFIANDRKGFYPAPGQVMEHVEKLMPEHKPNKWDKDILQSYERLKAINEKFRNEENSEARLYNDEPDNSYFEYEDGDLPDMADDELCDFYEPHNYDEDDYITDT